LPAQDIWLPVLWFFWAVMYVLTILASRMIYIEAMRREQNAELGVLINVITGISGLFLILMGFFALDLRGVWAFSITGSLLVVLGPLIYMVLPKRRGGGGAG